MNALDKAIKIAGSQTALGRSCGVTYQAVQKWTLKGIPPEKVLPIYRATLGAVTPHEMRPDLYPDPAWVPPLDAEWWSPVPEEGDAA